MALLAIVGCATASSPRANEGAASLSAQRPPQPPSVEARAAYTEANGTLMRTQGMSLEAIAAAHARALGIYNRALSLIPDYMDALNDKAWILATTPDPALRRPSEALELARRALDSLAQTGMLRANREAFAEDHTTGRMLVAATTFAAALAANGIFGGGSTTLAAANCLATADTVMAFVVEAAVDQDVRFRTPSTAEMVRRAREYQASFSQRRPLVGAVPLFSLLSPATRLR
jgi:tetratricopeptide (TPR) repeat protein